MTEKDNLFNHPLRLIGILVVMMVFMAVFALVFVGWIDSHEREKRIQFVERVRAQQAQAGLTEVARPPQSESDRLRQENAALRKRVEELEHREGPAPSEAPPGAPRP